MGTTEKLARWIVDFDYGKLPSEGAANIKISILDSIGVALVGAVQPTGVKMKQLVQEAGGNPQARVLRYGFKVDALNAAMANGTFAHVEDYDDLAGFGHCGVVLTPPILALGESLKLSGKKTMEAFAVGFEVGTRLAASLGEIQTQSGFHSTGLLGTMAAAAESAKLLGLNVEQTRAALGTAASLVSGIMQNAGMDAKSLHAGAAARNGILAASLAQKGFTGDPDVLEGPRGFFYVYGTEQAAIKRLNDNLGKILAIANINPIIKIWPCCYANHQSIMAMLHILEKSDFKPEDVAGVNVIGPGKVSNSPLIRHRPQKGFEGKFSMEYNMATVLVDRKIDLNSFSDEKLSRPIIQDLMNKVTISQDPELVDRPLRLSGDWLGINVIVKLKNGQVLSQKESVAHGHKGEAIYSKYTENAIFADLSKPKIENSISMVKDMENIKDITELMDNLIV